MVEIAAFVLPQTEGDGAADRLYVVVVAAFVTLDYVAAHSYCGRRFTWWLLGLFIFLRHRDEALKEGSGDLGT